jgi:uncharacterized paraquat-inducible protein A
MINLDFSLAIAGYLTVFLVIILFLWLWAKKQRNKEQFLDPKFIWFCSICTYTYINTKQDSLSVCPRCGSYNKKLLT